MDTAGGLGGIKYDQGKVPLALIPTEALLEVGKVMGHGASKYGNHNWRGGLTQLRVLSACLRHIYAHLQGEDKDPESGLLHLAHATANLLFVLTFILEGREGLDDRYRPAKHAPQA